MMMENGEKYTRPLPTGRGSIRRWKIKNKILIYDNWSRFKVMWRGRVQSQTFLTLGDALKHARALGQGTVRAEDSEREGPDSQW